MGERTNRQRNERTYARADGWTDDEWVSEWMNEEKKIKI